MIRCPECNAIITIPEGAEVWDHIFCQACGAELEIVALEPPEVEIAYDGFMADIESDDEIDEWDEEREAEDEAIYPWEEPPRN